MKRKTTELEQKLLNCGFVLFGKTYTGKYSQHIENYIYKKVVEITLGEEKVNTTFVVELDQSRNNVDNYYFEINYRQVDYKTLIKINDIYKMFSEKIREFTNFTCEYELEDFNDEEIVESVECVENEED